MLKFVKLNIAFMYCWTGFLVKDKEKMIMLKLF